MNFLKVYTSFSLLTNASPCIAYEGNAMEIAIPAKAYSTESLSVEPRSNRIHFTQWNKIEHVETYRLLQNIAQVWKKNGIEYLVYGKDSPDGKFDWEAIPYPKKEFQLWKQIKILAKIVFGQSKASKKLFDPSSETINKVSQTAKGNDAFCDPHVIKKQLIWEGKKIRVIYNYAPYPIGKDKLHFLFIPKEHRQDFNDLTEEEYVEAAELTQQFIDHYRKKGYDTAHVFHKNGARAGQTVFHWHQHLVFTTSKWEEFVTKLKIFHLWYSKKLNDEDLKKRISIRRQEFQN